LVATRGVELPDGIGVTIVGVEPLLPEIDLPWDKDMTASDPPE
jgi:hypothetical protein